MKSAEDIVLALASSNPINEDREYAPDFCQLCRRNTMQGHPEVHGIDQHAADCAWRLAREWVERISEVQSGDRWFVAVPKDGPSVVAALALPGAVGLRCDMIRGVILEYRPGDCSPEELQKLKDMISVASK